MFVFTGARAITMNNVLISDIIKVRINEKGTLIQINYRVTKGISNWNHVVSFNDGTDERDDNFIYWFSKHIKKHFDLEIEKFNDWKNENRKFNWNQRIWPGSVETYRETLKTRAQLEDFQEKFLDFIH